MTDPRGFTEWEHEPDEFDRMVEDDLLPEQTMTAQTLSDELVDKLRGAARGLCTEDPSGYIPRGVNAADCLAAADLIERIQEEARKCEEVLREVAFQLNGFPEILRATGYGPTGDAVQALLVKVRTALSADMGEDQDA